MEQKIMEGNKQRKTIKTQSCLPLSPVEFKAPSRHILQSLGPPVTKVSSHSRGQHVDPSLGPEEHEKPCGRDRKLLPCAIVRSAAPCPARSPRASCLVAARSELSNQRKAAKYLVFRRARWRGTRDEHAEATCHSGGRWRHSGVAVVFTPKCLASESDLPVPCLLSPLPCPGPIDRLFSQLR